MRDFIDNSIERLNEFTRMELLELSDDDSKWNRYKRRTTIDDFEVSVDDIEDLEIDFQDVDLLTADALANSGTTSEYDFEQGELSDEEYLKLKQQGFTGYNNDRNKNNINNQELDTFNKLALVSPDLVMWAKVRKYEIVIVFQDFVKHFNEIASKDDLEKKLENYIMTALDMCDLLVDCSCPDNYYRFSWVQSQGGFGFFKQNIPAPIRNPEERGAMCKHLNKLLDRWDLWESKLVNLIVQKLKDKDYLALKTN